jgi:uncharacterized repeat protein (TIGR01451 family)
MFKNIFVIALLFVCTIIVSSSALAQPAPPDLQVQMQGPTAAMVRSPYLYTVNVKNTGKTNAANVTVVVDFPLTNTSPTVYILGNLSGINTGCQVVSRKLNCNLGTINKNKTKSFTFNFTYPVTTKPLELKATASTTTPGEVNLVNNQFTLTQPVSYATNQLTSATVLVSLCTGTNLTSYFECELFPSSIQSFTMTLNSDSTITIPNYAGYTGNWDQLTSPQNQTLHFTVTETSTGDIAEFNGFAISGTCFEGLTTFTPNNGYISPYKVCVQ